MAGGTRTPATSAATMSRRIACMASPSEVVGNPGTGVARRRVAVDLFVAVVHRVGATGQRLGGLGALLVQQVEHRHVESQLAVSPHRAVLEVHVEQLFPRCTALGAIRGRLTEAEVVIAAVT